MQIIYTVIGGLVLAVLLLYFKAVWYNPDARKFNFIQSIQLFAALATGGIMGYLWDRHAFSTLWGLVIIIIVFLGTDLVAAFSPHENTKNKPDDQGNNDGRDAKGSGHED